MRDLWVFLGVCVAFVAGATWWSGRPDVAEASVPPPDPITCSDFGEVMLAIEPLKIGCVADKSVIPSELWHAAFPVSKEFMEAPKSGI